MTVIVEVIAVLSSNLPS